MEAKFILADDEDLQALYERLRSIAEEGGINTTDALKEALAAWIAGHGSQPNPSITMYVTTDEFKALRTFLHSLRSQWTKLH